MAEAEEKGRGYAHQIRLNNISTTHLPATPINRSIDQPRPDLTHTRPDQSNVSNNASLAAFRHRLSHSFRIQTTPRSNPKSPRSLAHQSSSSSFLAMAFFLASSASARDGPRLGVGVLLRLLSEPFGPVRLMPESRACRAAGFLPGRAGGVGAAGLARPLGGGGGARGAATGAGADFISST